MPRRRLGRAATFAFGVALAASACSDSHAAPDAAVDDAGTDDAGPREADAGAREDAGALDDAGPTDLDAGEEDAGTDAGGVAPPYGAPPADGA